MFDLPGPMGPRALALCLCSLGWAVALAAEVAVAAVADVAEWSSRVVLFRVVWKRVAVRKWNLVQKPTWYQSGKVSANLVDFAPTSYQSGTTWFPTCEPAGYADWHALDLLTRI